LESLIRKNAALNRLSFTRHLPQAVRDANVIFIAVGTPPTPTGEPDISAIFKALDEMVDVLLEPNISSKTIVNKSTVPIGMGKKVAEYLFQKGVPHHRFSVVSNPEFLREGSAVQDFLQPDRIVLGCENEAALNHMEDLYRSMVNAGIALLKTDLETAELIKYASNAFLATKISFINEIANLCDLVGADVTLVSKGMGQDHRIGRHFLNAGMGYGGSCFPKDTQALVAIASSLGYSMDIVKAVEKVNAGQKQLLFKKISTYFNGQLSGKTFGILGLSFKPNTDDMREAPSLQLIDALLKAGAKLQVYDPAAMPNSKLILGNTVSFADNAYEAIKGADAMVVVTEWNDFIEMDFEKVRQNLKEPLIFDARNIYDPKKLKELHFKYIGIGRSSTV